MLDVFVALSVLTWYSFSLWICKLVINRKRRISWSQRRSCRDCSSISQSFELKIIRSIFCWPKIWSMSWTAFLPAFFQLSGIGSDRHGSAARLPFKPPVPKAKSGIQCPEDKRRAKRSLAMDKKPHWPLEKPVGCLKRRAWCSNPPTLLKAGRRLGPP